MRSFLVVILLIFSTSILAQKAEEEKKWSASITGAIIPLPEINVGIQPGLAYQFNDRYALSTEVTIRLGNKDDKNLEAINKQYFRVQPELRYYLKSKKRKRKDYTGLRLSYASRKFEDITKGFYANKFPGNNGIFYDRAKINSPVFTTSIQYGTDLPINKNFSFDFFLGMGIRSIRTTYTDVINPIPGVRSRPADGPSLYASYSYNGKVLWFHFNSGFRFKWHFM